MYSYSENLKNVFTRAIKYKIVSAVNWNKPLIGIIGPA
jgi:hypothetical protein